jgi:hypothetical protein
MGIHLLPFSDNDRIGITIEPNTRLRPLTLSARGIFRNRNTVASGRSSLRGFNLFTPVDYFLVKAEKVSLTTIYSFANVAIGFDGILGKGKEETTEEEIAGRANSELNTSATVDTKTAEQIIPWLAISQSSSLRVSHMTEHLETALWLIEHLLKKQITVLKHSDCISISSKGA